MAEPKRGSLFLGGVLDPSSGERAEQFDYEARRFTTHGVIVGMTGSGKTGLGVILLEEALASGIPALIIDPKGDMGNLLLNFPDFEASDFRPWIDEAQADREGVSAEELATSTADMWKTGLESWGVSPDRMRALRAGADFTIYTPGSTAGVAVNIVGSLKAPALDWEKDAETGREEIEAFVSSLLMLAGISSDPISSPDHILLATLIERAWQAGEDLDLATLIGQIIKPPIRKLGVFELDTFFPEKDRTKLAMQLNGLMASPSFASWMQGQALDIQEMLYTEDGRPRAAVMYLPHLSDEERQFIVTLVLSKVVTWMRSQPGTSDLRAFIYMDEVFGFAPPTAEPPSKKPILTILKQARAHGVGMVLSTQNPVDLDYKTMSNAGTWMVGRLQTERDKARILEGIKTASGEVDVKAFDALIGDLGKRQFVLSSTKQTQPVIFETRWAMSYLRGPLTKAEVGVLTDESGGTISSGAQQPGSDDQTQVDPVTPLADDETTVPPKVADGIGSYYLDPAAPWAASVGADPNGTKLAAGLIARVELLFDDTKAGVDHRETWETVIFPISENIDPAQGFSVDYDDRDLLEESSRTVTYELPDAPIDTKTYFSTASRVLKDHLYRNRNVTVIKNAGLRLYSRVGESEADFLARCSAAAEDAADADVAKLKERYRKLIATVESQLKTAERRVNDLEVDVSGRRQQEMMGGAGDLLGVFLKGRRRSSGLSKAASRRNQTRKTEQRLASAEDKYNEKLDKLDDLEDRLAEDFQTITAKWEGIAAEIESVDIGLEKTDITIDDLSLVWIPIA